MFGVRTALVGVVLVTSMSAPGLLPRRATLLPSLVFACVSTVLEALGRVPMRRGPAVITAGLLLDSAHLSWVVYASGGVASPLRFLVLAHIASRPSPCRDAMDLVRVADAALYEARRTGRDRLGDGRRRACECLIDHSRFRGRARAQARAGRGPPTSRTR